MLFVTDDKAFYEGREHSNGLAAALREESSCNRSFTLFARLADLLKELRSHVAIDHDALTAALLAKEFGSLEGLLQRNGFQLAERTKLEAELFLTEKPHTCSWNSRSDSDAIDISGSDRGDGLLTFRGDGFYDSATGQFSNLGELGTELRFRDTEGVEQERRNVALRAGGIVLGHADVSHTIRHRLD